MIFNFIFKKMIDTFIFFISKKNYKNKKYATKIFFCMYILDKVFF